MNDKHDHLFDALHFMFRDHLMGSGGKTYVVNDIFGSEPKVEDATLTMPLDQFETIREGLNPESYVINMEEGSDGIWRATSATMNIVLNHRM